MSLPADPSATPAAQRDRRYACGVWIILAVAALLRIGLILRGGQYAFFDESRYYDSLDGAAEILHGHLTHGLALPLEKGDHVGFKELGLIPALVQTRLGGSDRIPALFFGSFSLVTIGLLGLIARRLSGSVRAQFWAVLAAGTSASLFYFSRHLLPYDASLCCLTAGLALGVTPRPAGWKLGLAGLLAGAGFVIYYGYWTLAGVVLLLLPLLTAAGKPRSDFVTVVRRAVSLGLGFLAALAVPVAINHLWGTGEMIGRARTFSATITQGDFNAVPVPWEYLWASDHLETVLVVVFTVVGAFLAFFRRDNQRGPLLRPAVAAAWGVIAIWGAFMVAGNGLHHFSVYDRLIRQLLPFLILGFAFGWDDWLRRFPAGRSQRSASLVLAAILVANAAWSFTPPLRQVFPRDFEREGRALLATRPDPDSPDAYYQFVNVTRYAVPETLDRPPLETLLQAPHFYQYRPYLFSGGDAQERATREAVDHRMRLVKLALPPAWKIAGDPYGTVTLKVRLARGRTGVTDPLLSVGAREGGDFFFLHYPGDHTIALGFFSTGNAILQSDPIAVEPGSLHTVELFCGDLIPPGRSDELDEDRKRVVIKLDGATVLETTIQPKTVVPAQVYVGVRATFQNFTTSRFGGEITGIHRSDTWQAAPDTHLLAFPATASVLRMDVRTGQSPLNTAEPLVVVGVPGKAVFVYLRRLPGGFVKLGCEFWGVGAWESDPVAASPTGPDRAEFQIGPLLPPEGSPGWGDRPRAEETRLRHSLLLRWNATSVLSRTVKDYVVQPTAVSIGRDLIGGSSVVERFSGVILRPVLVPLPTQ